ncbi:MAG: methyltransferase domain-containing protein [Thermoflexia bacterium]|nr:MAG: methyltransferase domain-containing protein [Thermoflexia bacterium]
MTWVWVVLGLLVLGGLVYWQLGIAEGTYLGPRVVAWLYDLVAPAYDRIKGFDAEMEQWYLGLPLALALDNLPAPLVLDVGCGTARLARALFFQPRFRGRVVGVDLSRRMLARAVQETGPWADRVTFIRRDARSLPFPNDTFDAVASLEMLEFTPDPRGVVRELVRVLRPGGILLVSNRIGTEARLMPGRAFPTEDFVAFLQTLPLERVHVQPWQVYYDLVWARKAGRPTGGGVRPLGEILRCPECGHVGLESMDGAWQCLACARRYPVRDGILEMEKGVR